MHYTVYKIVNKINGKVYIGKHQTKDLNDDYMGSGKLVKRSIDKYGAENFSKAILFDFDNEELMNAKERELVTEEFCLREDTYNICVGGQGGFSYINREGLSVNNFNKSTAAKYAKLGGEKTSHKFRNDSTFRDNQLLNLLKGCTYKSFLGKQHSGESKKKMSESKTGKNCGEHNSQFGSMWITNGTENKKIKKVDFLPEGWHKGRKI